MPFAAPLAFAPLLSFLATPIIGGLTIGSVVTTVALSGASYAINKALAPKVKGSGLDEGQKSTIQQAVPSQRLIYGKSLVGGPIFFYECKPPYLYIGIVLASHEIDAVEKFYINGKLIAFDGTGSVSTSNFVNGATPYVYASVRLGTDTQAIDPILAADFPELPSTFRQRGHATIVLKCDYGSSADDHEKYWGSGAPQLQFLVRGMKVYDPLDAAQSISDPATWQWSDNASLCLAHYLTYAKGCNLSWDSLDTAELKIAATHDNESVTLASGEVEARYTINGVVDLATDPAEVVQNMLTANLGKLIWRAGVYSILSGVARNPVWTFNDDSARGDMSVRQHRDRKSLINVVRTVFVAPDREYQTANGPVLRNATYVAADGVDQEMTITLPFTASHQTAQRIAKATMERSRLGKTMSRREDMEGLRLNAGDVANIEVGFLAALGGTFEINLCKLDPDKFEVEIEAEEYDASIYDWSASEEQAFTIAPAELAGVN
ncbi:MAG: hypothetical protein IPM06_20505 [Rhizobiales bacterium]|nr:hypothetical protein [Hyphomicrobiales bacterium]